jgi:hypothetical protein
MLIEVPKNDALPIKLRGIAVYVLLEIWCLLRIDLLWYNARSTCMFAFCPAPTITHFIYVIIPAGDYWPGYCGR